MNVCVCVSIHLTPCDMSILSIPMRHVHLGQATDGAEEASALVSPGQGPTVFAEILLPRLSQACQGVPSGGSWLVPIAGRWLGTAMWV